MDDPSIMTLEEWRRAKEVFDAAWELETRAGKLSGRGLSRRRI
jgi:hypothetical protein